MLSKKLRADINELAHDLGYWNEVDLCKKLLLIVSEACEAMEADRKSNYCKLSLLSKESLLRELSDVVFVYDFESDVKHTFEDEICDLTIRTSDLAYELKIDLELHIALKHRYNCIKGKDKLKNY